MVELHLDSPILLNAAMLNPFKTKCVENNIYKNSVRTSQETHYVSATKNCRLMLFRETVDVHCENHTEHTNTLPNNI
jgi:hypothetical protein